MLALCSVLRVGYFFPSYDTFSNALSRLVVLVYLEGCLEQCPKSNYGSEALLSRLADVPLPDLCLDDLNADERGGGVFARQHTVAGLTVSGVYQAVGKAGVGACQSLGFQNRSRCL